MKTFTFYYDPKATIKNPRELMLNAVKSGIPYIEQDQIQSSSLKALLSVATENRLKLFKIIHNDKPESLYELSKAFYADISYISKEIRVLEGFGLISIIKENVNGRERLKPIALYDRIVLDFDLANKNVS